MKALPDGDNFLSASDRKIWDFTYWVLAQFGCPIMHKVTGPNCRIRQNLVYEFFVPEGRQDVADYIIQEWAEEVREPEEINEHEWFWGCEVRVYFFNGVGYYIEQSVVKDMAQNMMLYINAKLKGKDANISDFSIDNPDVKKQH
jgi:hypothetical protein